MNISRFGALWALVTGGWSGLAIYALEGVNSLLAKCDVETLKKTAKIVSSVATTVKGVIEVFVSKEAVKNAAGLTVSALEDLAKALEDGELTKDELDSNIETITSCVNAWKAVA